MKMETTLTIKPTAMETANYRLEIRKGYYYSIVYSIFVNDVTELAKALEVTKVIIPDEDIPEVQFLKNYFCTN